MVFKVLLVLKKQPAQNLNRAGCFFNYSAISTHFLASHKPPPPCQSQTPKLPPMTNTATHQTRQKTQTEIHQSNKKSDWRV